MDNRKPAVTKNNWKGKSRFMENRKPAVVKDNWKTSQFMDNWKPAVFCEKTGKKLDTVAGPDLLECFPELPPPRGLSLSFKHSI